MKVPFLSILDNDFIDHLGVRHTHFSLCRVDHGKTRACAVVAFADNAVVREAFSSGLSHRADAIRRLELPPECAVHHSVLCECPVVQYVPAPADAEAVPAGPGAG